MCDAEWVNISSQLAYGTLPLDVTIQCFGAGYKCCLLNMRARAVRRELSAQIDQHDIRIVKDSDGMLMSRKRIDPQVGLSGIAFGKRKSAGNIIT